MRKSARCREFAGLIEGAAVPQTGRPGASYGFPAAAGRGRGA